MDYVQVTESQRSEMLETIGADSVEQLYRSLPEHARLDEPLNLPDARSELQLQRDLATIAATNRAAADLACFLGGGAYDHYIPSVVDDLSSKGEFVTAYTPYQAEASQGSLQAFFEFQTQVCRLTSLDIANASLYEGSTAVAEGVMMALNVTGKRRVLVASTLHPDHRRVLKTYLADLPAELIELPAVDGRVDVAATRDAIDQDTACVVVQSPNALGLIEDWAGHFEAAHEQDKTLGIAVFNPIACGLLKRPGDCGADVAAGEGQPLGIPMQYGGPYLGLFAARKSLLRKMPGRLIGQTTDADGKRGFCLTLQTREQHIRGAKATSNVCTNQGLLALRATVYMSAVGPAGLREAAEQCYHKAHYLAEQIADLKGYSLAYEGPFFNEFVVNCPTKAQAIIDAGRDRGILPGIDCQRFGIGSDDQLLVAVTEKRSREELDNLVSLLKETN